MALQRLSVILTLFFAIPAHAGPQQNPLDQGPEVWMTVFVHGIMSIKPHISLSNFARFMTDDVQNTVYSTTVELMRQDPIFFQNQAMQEIGLKAIDLAKIEKGYSSGAMAMVYETMSQFADNTTATQKNYYYTYGWSGLLSPKRRYIDAKLLYGELGQEVRNLQAQGINPKIRLVGYSHGGNVLLNLGRIAQEEPMLPSFNVDQLVLLGTPIQHETDYLVNAPIFKSVYHIYSHDDRIQKLDFFSFNRFFSGQVFKSRKGFDLPDKLVQIQLKCSRNYRNQKRAVHPEKHKNIAVASKHKKLRNASPGHSELWFFSWTPANYRHYFPLNPLPTASLVPLIINEVETLKAQHSLTTPTLLLDVRPNYSVILAKNKRTHKVMQVRKFLSSEEFEQLKMRVMAYKPDDYTLEKYNSGIQTAFNRAKTLRKHERVAHKHARKERVKVQHNQQKEQA